MGAAGGDGTEGDGKEGEGTEGEITGAEGVRGAGAIGAGSDVATGSDAAAVSVRSVRLDDEFGDGAVAMAGGVGGGADGPLSAGGKTVPEQLF